MNICNFFGRISSDIDLRVNGETTIAQFSIAVNRHTKEHGVDFFRFKAFNRTAEVLSKYFHKGSRICVSATATQPQKYTNKDGVTVYPNVEFVVREIDFVDTKAESNASQSTDGPTQAQSSTEAPKPNNFMSIPDGIADELPFS